ncbi:MAG: NAD(P)/FAD-dependent oxidoreductase [Actinophytocola sp.]|uniref:NAD(P)/FAD-dependent oxidoreductase n=1 Tax=Actinophytocola sp. TaxID=1872138 RepID=UPI00132A3427|nr:FAD-dependent oxidoreductase [Actinophytocola sp.]MPZ83575.1 NAD(P)/FAD-dependent oxidoreductase [Actinophytocola sp.]
MSAERSERIVVVGAGAAGLRAAERVRELGFTGELMILTEEPFRPYHRPALTKQLLTGAVRPKDLLLPYADLDAVWRYRTRVARLDPEEHLLFLPGGEEIEYDGLVIATGMQPRHLPGAPRQDPRVHVMRSIGDAIRIQKNLRASKGRVAMIGGGWLSGEVASAARELGRDATIIMREDAMLRNVPGHDVSETVSALHEAHGVRLVTEAAVTNWRTGSDGVTMHLSTGEVVVADCVVLGVGAVPAVDWLRGSGLFVDDGVLCDPTTHALGAEDIVVAGDVARWPNLRFDTVPRRVEHWINAVEMGRASAENLLVGREDAKPYTPLPRFWSDQHGVRIQASGIPALAQDTVSLTGSKQVSSRVTGYLAGGSLVGVVAWDSPRGMLKWTKELDKKTTEAMRRRQSETKRPARPAAPAVPPAYRAPVATPTSAPMSAAMSALAYETQTPRESNPQDPRVQHSGPASPTAGSGYQEPVAARSGYHTGPAARSGYQQSPGRPGYQRPPARPGYQEPAAARSGYYEPAASRSGYHEQPRTGSGYYEQLTRTDYEGLLPQPGGYGPPPPAPRDYRPPMNPREELDDPAVTTLPQIDSWRMAS